MSRNDTQAMLAQSQSGQPLKGTPNPIIAQALADRMASAKDAQEEADSEATTSARTAALAMAMSGGASPEPTQAALLTSLLELVQGDLAEKRAKKDAKEQELRRLKDAQVKNVALLRQRQEAAQQFCDHKKENGRSRIVGQRHSNGHVGYLCQYCLKQWDETTLPPHLAISFDDIGG